MQRATQDVLGVPVAGSAAGGCRSNLAVLVEAAVRNYILQLGGRRLVPVNLSSASNATWNRVRHSDGDANSCATEGGNEVVIISGLSGSGKSVALKVLEDAGYCIDNLPVNFMPEVVRCLYQEDYRNLAISVDVRRTQH